MAKYLERLEYLIGKENIKSLKKKYVLICGCGGVGGYVAEALARSGIGHITLVDYDFIDESNLNRQIMTNKNNIGLNKCEELKKRIEEVSDTKVKIINTFIDDSFKFDRHYDYVVDCIDTLTSKFILVKKAHQENIKIISSMGTAKRIKVDGIKRTTLDKTKNDPLAKAFRSLVKKENYKKKIDVVYSESLPINVNIVKKGKTNKEKYPLASSIFPVASVGLKIAECVFIDLLDNGL